jgi:two-component system chemotaxis response regulator CheY
MALNVLIVDDSPMMRSLIGRVLTLSGLEIGCRLNAGNGAEALSVMNEQPVDLVLVDINMPVMNGEDLVREMQRTEELRSIPVVVISTDGTNRRMERMRDLGVYGYLQKPFRPEELRNEVERVMETPSIPLAEINAAVASASTRVLETMCFIYVADTMESQLDRQKTPIGVAVHFAGSMSGSLELWASHQFASSLAMNFLGNTNVAGASPDHKFMLNELANMMCGAVLTQLCSDGEFRLDSPVPISRESSRVMGGQYVESDDGSMWVFFEIGPNRWREKAQSAY